MNKLSERAAKILAKAKKLRKEARKLEEDITAETRNREKAAIALERQDGDHEKEINAIYREVDRLDRLADSVYNAARV